MSDDQHQADKRNHASVASESSVVPPLRPAVPLDPPWRLLLRWRWPAGMAIALAFAIGQLLETLFFTSSQTLSRLILDVIAWGALGGLSVWASFTWLGRQERRYQLNLEHALDEQRMLNEQLQRSNSQLALLSEVNRRIADTLMLDEIVDLALDFPQRLLPVRACALQLIESAGVSDTRVTGASSAELTAWRAAFGITPQLVQERQPRDIQRQVGSLSSCLIVPLHDGVASVGWLELYRETAMPIQADELSLLETIGSEIAEAVVNTRRRSREEHSIYELEQAIAEERARIARDIHDGIAQSLAFMRMRIDLWREWISEDPARLDNELQVAKGTLRDQIRELRRAIFALRPIQFDELGFVAALQRYIVEFANQHGWKIQVDLSGAPPTLSPALEAICFRVIQEALTNAAKHAEAQTVSVKIDQADHGLRITVRDDGRGFDAQTEQELDPSHIGLRQIRERLAGVRGRLQISSTLDAGTELQAWIPLSLNEIASIVP